MTIILILLIIAAVPIWRVAGSQQGYSGPEAAYRHLKTVNHIPAEEAIGKANDAYNISRARA